MKRIPNGRATLGMGLFLVVVAGAAILGPMENAVGSRPEPANCRRYSLPAAILKKPFSVGGEIIPLEREDVRTRIQNQVNFLLLDARSVLTDWVTERSRYAWIFDETLAREGVPREFAWFAPILGGISKSGGRAPGAGWWALETKCSSTEGVSMSEDSWRDDRMDFELSTRCFAARIKAARKDLGTDGWLMPAAAYVTSVKTVQDLMQRWETRSYWDLPFPENADELIPRWIALMIIHTHPEDYGLKLKDISPFTFDQVTGLVLKKDLTVAELARIAGISSREILEMNPKLKVAAGLFPTGESGNPHVHVVAVPKGKGLAVLKGLKEGGFVDAIDQR